MPGGSLFERVHAMVRGIPHGRVASYGQIAALCEHPHAARTVGWALHGIPDELADPKHPDAVPWWRVLSAAGRISTSHWGDTANLQQELLEAEGVQFGPEGQVDMRRYKWESEYPTFGSEADPGNRRAFQRASGAPRPANAC